MNRQQRREAEKLFRRKGYNRKDTKDLAALLEIKDKVLPASDIKDGDKVRLNVWNITSRSAYPEMQEGFRTFVEANQNTVFTVKILSPVLATFEENDRWRFWTGDLIKTKEDDA